PSASRSLRVPAATAKGFRPEEGRARRERARRQTPEPARTGPATDPMTEREPMIEAIDLCKNYGSFVAIDHLTFTIRRGEVVAFLGPNGAGKSTTMKV